MIMNYYSLAFKSSASQTLFTLRETGDSIAHLRTLPSIDYLIIMLRPQGRPQGLEDTLSIERDVWKSSKRAFPSEELRVGYTFEVFGNQAQTRD